MGYFTIWHILVLICAVFAFILLTLLIYLKKEKIKNFIIFVGLSLISISLVTYAIMISLDDKLKTAIIIDTSAQRVYINETIVFKAKIKNTSKYSLSKCYIDVQMGSSLGKLQDFGEHLTKKNHFFSFLYKNKKDSATPIKTSVVVENIKPFEIRGFSAILSFPPKFVDPKFVYKVKCR